MNICYLFLGNQEGNLRRAPNRCSRLQFFEKRRSVSNVSIKWNFDSICCVVPGMKSLKDLDPPRAVYSVHTIWLVLYNGETQSFAHILMA